MEDIRGYYVFQVFLINKGLFENRLNNQQNGIIYLKKDVLHLKINGFDFIVKISDDINFFRFLNKRTFECVFYLEGKENIEVLGRTKLELNIEKKTKKILLLV